jgi:membrane-associated phospholipid phosphatase
MKSPSILTRAAMSLAAALCLGAQAPAFAADDAVIQWNKVALEVIRSARPGPPVTARALHIVHACMYDAWSAYDAKAKPSVAASKLAKRPSAERTPTFKSEAISYAAYTALLDLFPAQRASFDKQMATLGYEPANRSTSPTTGAGLGNAACAQVLALRHADGSNQLGDAAGSSGKPYSDYTGYKPSNPAVLPHGGSVPMNPNHWEPLILNGVAQSFTAPHWGRVKPFALTAANALKLPAPALAGSSAYAEQARELLDMSAKLTDKQKVIAEYWADGPNSEYPPGHWNVFAQYVSARDRLGLDANVKLFFTLNNAMLDASIWCWGQKVLFDSPRPITAIHDLYNGQSVVAWQPGVGVAALQGQYWQPYQAAGVVTPPFAEYVSGHSTFSAAAAEVLMLATRSDVFGASFVAPVGSSKVEPGQTPAAEVPLSWPTFTDAANEAGLSRRYGGIHFKQGDMMGRLGGRLIGANAYLASQKLFQ